MLRRFFEVAQGVFGTVKEKQEAYRSDIAQRDDVASVFLAQTVDVENATGLCEVEVPELPVSEYWNGELASDLDLSKYPSLEQVDAQVEKARGYSLALNLQFTIRNNLLRHLKRLNFDFCRIDECRFSTFIFLLKGERHNCQQIEKFRSSVPARAPEVTLPSEREIESA
jgi:hypothetical protein